MKKPVAVFLASLAALAAQAVPLKIVNPSFEPSAEGDCVGWTLSPGMRANRTAGHNGSGGLVWSSAGPNVRQDYAAQNVPLRAGKAYAFSVLVKTEGFQSKKYGATMCVEWFDAKGKWIAGAYAHGVTKPDEDWTLVKGVTRDIPANAARVTAMIYITSGCSGKAYFDNVSIEPVDRDPVAFVFSSAYRNVAAEGNVRFHASLYRPEGVTGTRAVFVRRDAAGAEKRVAPTQETADGATLALDVRELPTGRSEVACELLTKEGRLLGRAACPFERVTALPKRRVWIDAHRRCIVDGKPFFPLGLYSGKIDDEMLDRYCEGPFNVVMPYAATTCRELDLLQARGLHGFVSLRSQLLGTDWAKRNGFTRQDQVDAFYEREIGKTKNHPALLGWYVCDECPATEIPDRTHLHGVFARADPDHPTWAVLDRTYDLREFIPTFDVLGMDPYPIGRKPLKHVTELVRETQKAVFGDVPLWNVPQAFDWSWFRKEPDEKDLRFPTEAEIANMAWQHVALGANGLVAYNFHSLKRDCDPKLAPEFWGRIRRAFEPVKKMMPVLLSVDPAPAIGKAPEMMPVRRWMKDGELHVLAVNPLRRAQTASLFVGDGPWTLGGVEVGAVGKAAVAGNRIDLTLASTGYAMLRLVRAANPSAGAQDIVCERTDYPFHLQGVTTDGTNVYWTFTTVLAKTDRAGREIGRFEMPREAGHLGDLKWRGGKVYVGVGHGTGAGNARIGDEVWVFDAATLKVERKHPTPEAVWGTNGLEWWDGSWWVISSAPKHSEYNYLFEYTPDFKFKQCHLVKSGWTNLGIQTILLCGNRLLLGYYGSDDDPVLPHRGGTIVMDPTALRKFAGRNDPTAVAPILSREEKLGTSVGMLVLDGRLWTARNPRVSAPGENPQRWTARLVPAALPSAK